MNHAHAPASRAFRLTGCLLLSMALLSCATTDGTRNEVKSEVAEDTPSAAQIDVTGLHPMARAIAQLGAPQCAQKVHEAAIFLIVDTESGAIMHSASKDLFSFSLEVIDPDGMTSYVSLNVAPGKDDACAISYEIVTPLGRDCETIAEQFWPEAVVGNPLRKQMIPLALPEGQTVLLHPVGETACIVIRKEIIP